MIENVFDPPNFDGKYQSSHQLCSTQALTRFSYSRRFSLKSWAAIEFAGEFGLGSLSKLWMDVRMADTS